MANAISAVQGLFNLEQASHTPAAKPHPQASAIPQDTVTLSQTAKPAPAANQTTKTTQASGDVDHDGDSR